MHKVLAVFLLCMGMGYGIDFDKLEKKKVKHATKSLDFSDAVKAGEKEWRLKVKEDQERAAYIRAHTKPIRYGTGSIASPSTQTGTNTSPAPNRSSYKNSSKGVKNVYVGSKGARGQNLYVIQCRNGRSISGVWKKSNGLWMSVSTSFGHYGMSLDQVAEDYCR